MNAGSVAPETPPLLPSDWQRLAGQIGPNDEDFRVDEIPLYAFSGEGEHLLLHVEVRGVFTGDVLEVIAWCRGVALRDIGYAGMKDRHAVTTQWFSVATLSHCVVTA